MEYKKGDIVLLEAVKVKDRLLAGKLPVQVFTKKDGLYFKPFLLKKMASIPITAIDSFSPMWISDDDKERHIDIEEYIDKQGLLLYEVLWAVVSNAWEETKIDKKAIGLC